MRKAATVAQVVRQGGMLLGRGSDGPLTTPDAVIYIKMILRLLHLWSPQRPMLGSIPRSVRRIGWLAVLALAYVGLLWVQPEPPFHDFKARAELEYNGATITIEGPIRCSRSLLWLPFGMPSMPGHGGGNAYRQADVGIAQKMQDGSAVVVALYPPCAAPSRLEPFFYPDGSYPVVYWLDNAHRPNRVEAYFDRSGYKAPSARVKLKQVEMAYVGRSIMPRLGTTETVRAVPWTSQNLDVQRDRVNFVAYLAAIVPEEEWRKRPGAVDILSKQESWRRFSPRDGDKTANQVVTFPVGNFYLNCREFRDWLPSCRDIQHAFTIDAEAGRFILRRDRPTTGIAVFTRREQQPLGQPRITLFDLAGHEERLVGDASYDVFYDPVQRVLTSLKEHFLHW
jgi:hypothetical protein